jgi:hypothetical protein
MLAVMVDRGRIEAEVMSRVDSATDFLVSTDTIVCTTSQRLPSKHNVYNCYLYTPSPADSNQLSTYYK